MTEKPLFLPLNGLWYDEFVSGRKTREIRGLWHQYNTSTVKVGREVVLSRGYGKKNRMLGVITEVEVYYGINVLEVPCYVLREAIPGRLLSEPKVIEYCNVYSSKYDDLIVFKIEIKRW